MIDTSVLVPGISAFRPRLTRDNKSARLLRDWIEEESFVWLVSDDVLDQYTEVLRRLGVKRSTVGRVVNLLAEAATRDPLSQSDGSAADSYGGHAGRAVSADDHARRGGKRCDEGTACATFSNA